MVAKRLCDSGGVVILFLFFFVFYGDKQRQGKHEDVGLAEDTLFDRKNPSLLSLNTSSWLCLEM